MKKRALMIHPKFLECAASLPKAAKSKLVRILWLLSENTSHPGLQCKKVRGSQADVYECRVDRTIRLIYDVGHGTLRCWYVGKHDSALDFARVSAPHIPEILVDDIQVSHKVDSHIVHDLIHFMESSRTAERFLEMAVEDVCASIQPKKS